MYNSTDYIVIGSGFAGSVIARELAERTCKRILVIEKHNHIGGNAFDCLNKDGILVHKYGPHIFHTNVKRAYDHLSRFTDWNGYSHEVQANVYGKFMPVPFNLNSLYIAFDAKKAGKLEEKLITEYGMNQRISILKLREQADNDLQELADFIYNNVFLYYTKKQWGTTLDAIDATVAARVPVLISRDNRYFQDTYQGIPADGYTTMFKRMLDHPGICLKLNTNASDIFKIIDNEVFLHNVKYTGTVIYTGALDELFECRFGRLPYRTLDFSFETHNTTWFQQKGTVNYTVDQTFTRITEFKHLTGQAVPDKTTILKEYPREYTGAAKEIPYYPIPNTANFELYQKYKSLSEGVKNFHLLGRLAEYKYYNMDEITANALKLADNILRTASL